MAESSRRDRDSRGRFTKPEPPKSSLTIGDRLRLSIFAISTLLTIIGFGASTLVRVSVLETKMDLMYGKVMAMAIVASDSSESKTPAIDTNAVATIRPAK